MAFKKIELSKEEEESLQGGGNFVKFTAIGQKFLGRFLRSQPQTGTFAKADRADYVFRAPAKNEDGTVRTGADGKPVVEEAVINGTKRLHFLLNREIKNGHLKPNYAVKITLIAENDIGQANKEKVFDVEIDDVVGAAKPPPPPPPPADSAADDVPF